MILKEDIERVKKEQKEFRNLISGLNYQDSVNSILSKLKEMETQYCKLTVQDSGNYLDISIYSIFGRIVDTQRVLYNVEDIPECCHLYTELERLYIKFKNKLINRI